MKTQPTLYIPHGGGPCFFMDWTMGPADTWVRMGAWLRGLAATLPERPRAVLVVSAHWEAPVPTVMSGSAPPLLFDYSGFPEHTYALTWPAPGAPDVAQEVRAALATAGLTCASEPKRGFDHGVFVPMKLVWPDADVPTVQLSLTQDLDPLHHLAVGRALAPLRRQGVLVVGSGMSFHNMRAFGQARAVGWSQAFDDWMTQSVALPSAARADALAGWTRAPAARLAHPREEHLLPLMVAAGAADDDVGRVIFRDTVMSSVVSAVRFG